MEREQKKHQKEFLGRGCLQEELAGNDVKVVGDCMMKRSSWSAGAPLRFAVCQLCELEDD